MGSEVVSLNDKYALKQGQVFLTGIQALVRLPMMQHQRDVAEGLNTAGFISGYRGSPLGGLDQQLWRAEPFLKEHHIHFEPGINEDLAATAVWGSQQNELAGDSKYDGVYAMWYGKGPGVDRCGDVFRHANMAGSSKHGGVLLLAGDDHGAKSSTTAAQCEFAFMDAMMPVLAPSGVQEFLDLGIYGWALSRFSGAWVGFKVIGEAAESTASCSIDPNRIQIRYPSLEDFAMPQGGLNIRWPDDRFQQEKRLHRHKIYAALAFARANDLNKVIFRSKKPRFGIITAGKSYLDVRQALDDLDITEEIECDLGITLLKIGMVWPLEKEIVRHFAEGLEEILVVEEKRAVIENQLKEQLYNWREDVRPRVVGKFDETGEWILPSTGELTPSSIARTIAKRIAPFHRSEDIEQRLEFLDYKEKALDARHSSIKRLPWFCSGCPHNTSTKVPDGSRAMAGIGCHWMVLWMDRNTETFTQMGAEGVPWIGQAPFSKTSHVFANLGDGTYYHSGILAIRAAVAAGVNITYKILYNDAVAMTGGQPVEGSLSPARITHQLRGEGVNRIIVMSDEPDKYPIGTQWAHGVVIEHRDELERVQKELRRLDGVSILLYDQTCAAEKRRRRKRGLYPDPPKRAFINDLVCEGCGDCSVQSNCVSIVPLETEFGRKRAIDQSSCNKDFSCLKGFCPSFVTVEGGEIRKLKSGTGTALAAEGGPWQVLPEPDLPPLNEPYSLLVTGVGGTGVVTIGALLGMAAHIEGKGVTILDQTGLAQKGGAVVSHLRIAKRAEDLHAVRISAGNADLVLGCDLVVSAGFDALSKMTSGETKAIINSHEVMTGEFTHKPDMHFPADELRDLIIESTGEGNAEFLDATRLATALLGDSIATNLFILGYAWQRGFIPVGEAAILEAITLNGVAIEANSRAFTWGRRAAVDLPAVENTIQPVDLPKSYRISESLKDVVERRGAFLTSYQNSAYAARYETLIRKVETMDERVLPGRGDLTLAVARNYFKLLAIKDEYEVARLYSAPEFKRKLDQQFTGNYRLKLNLAPPLLARKDPETGHLIKREFGSWVFSLFKVLQHFKGLRGTAFDLFGYSRDRRIERALIKEYEATLEEILEKLTPQNYEIAVELASSPEKIRGYGHIKEANIEAAKICEKELLEAFRHPEDSRTAAE